MAFDMMCIAARPFHAVSLTSEVQKARATFFLGVCSVCTCDKIWPAHPTAVGTWTDSITSLVVIPNLVPLSFDWHEYCLKSKLTVDAVR